VVTWVVVHPGTSTRSGRSSRGSQADEELVSPIDIDLATAADVGVAETIDARLVNVDVDFC
jgi:hypothetical protein